MKFTQTQMARIFLNSMENRNAYIHGEQRPYMESIKRIHNHPNTRVNGGENR